MSEGGDFPSVVPYGFDDSERFSLRRKGISTTRGYYNDKKELHRQGVLQRQEGSNGENSSDDERCGGDKIQHSDGKANIYTDQVEILPLLLPTTRCVR